LGGFGGSRVIIFCEIFIIFILCLALATFATEINKSPTPTDIHTCRYAMCVYVLLTNIWCLFICNLVVVVGICIHIRFSQIGIESNDCRGTFAVNKAIQF